MTCVVGSIAQMISSRLVFVPGPLKIRKVASNGSAIARTCAVPDPICEPDGHA